MREFTVVCDTHGFIGFIDSKWCKQGRSLAERWLDFPKAVRERERERERERGGEREGKRERRGGETEGREREKVRERKSERMQGMIERNKRFSDREKR